jgi:S1-C subfamily serine protease
MAEARQSVFRVRSTACFATGTSFELNQGTLTNRHVATGSSLLQLSTGDGNDFGQKVESLSSSSDLAVLGGTNNGNGSPLTLAEENPADGSAVWVTGYPQGNELSIDSGVVSDYLAGAPYGEPGQVMEISNSIQPGNSGSPLLNSSGQVVGIAFAISKLDGAGLAIPVSALQSFLSDPGTSASGPCADLGSTGSTGNSGPAASTGTTGNT